MSSWRFILLVVTIYTFLGVTVKAYQDAIVIEAEDELTQKSDASEGNEVECKTKEGKAGNCKTLKECFPMMTSVYKSQDLIDDFYRLVKSENCSSDGKNETSAQDVCCKKPSNGTVTKDPTYGASSNAECGKQKIVPPRIVGGNYTYVGEYPWMVAVFGKNGKLTCGGTLIDNQHVLCAAHCIENYGKTDVGKLRLHLGDYNIHSVVDVPHVTRKVSKIIKHKYFDINTFVNDITLFKMSEPVEFSDYIQPICLSSGQTTGEGIVAGWGRIAEKSKASSYLLKVTVPFVSNSECARVYNGIAPKGILSNMVCAGAKGVDSCIGDSGGPLMVSKGGENKVYTQVGIVSFGKGCAELPGVYTRVESFATWISNNRIH